MKYIIKYPGIGYYSRDEMSIICENCHGWVLDHSKLIDKIYVDIKNDSRPCEESPSVVFLNSSFNYNKNMFMIATPYLYDTEALNNKSDIVLYKIHKKRKYSSSASSPNDTPEVRN